MAYAFDPDFAAWHEWAQAYRQLGLWQVVPCWLPSERKPGESWKRPKLSEWARYRDDRIDDVVFNKWYGVGGEHVLRQNMGALTGKGAGDLLVVDLDLYKGGEAAAWWHELIESENNGIPIETVEQITGGGGRQMFFTWPKGRHAPTNRTPRGIDIRGDGGFVVLPPSMHESGKPYRWAPGRAPWETTILAAPEWLVEAVESLVEAYGGHQGGAGPSQRTSSPGEDYTAFGSRQDGRETEMFRAVWRAVLELYRVAPIMPMGTLAQDASWKAYEAYEAKVVSRVPGTKREGLEKEGRGPKAWAQKWRREMRNWGSPKMVREAAKPDPNPNTQFDPKDFESAAAGAQQQANAGAPGALYDMLDVKQIKQLADPRWLVSGLIPEASLGFFYGPPGCLKTFMGLDLALSLANSRKTWMSKGVEHAGAVVYISSEGLSDLKFRVMAWEQHNNVAADESPFRLIHDSINFTKPDDVGKLIATVESVASSTQQPIAAVFVDTVSRVLPGVDENLQKDMTVFIYACDQVRKKFSTAVVGLHHTARAGNMRGSTVIPGAGDYIVEVRREEGAMDGSFFVHKIKAAQDGWEQFFKVTKVQLATIGAHTSLVLEPTERSAEDADLDERGWPAREILREILAAIAEAWFKKQPWGRAPNHARPAKRLISQRWRLKTKVVQEILDAWETNGIIAEEQLDARLRLKGYRKLTDL